MTRARWSVVIAVSILAAVVRVPADAFSDVEDDAFFATAVQWLYESGITAGTSAGCFSPEAPVTRGQAAAFLHRLEGSPAAPAPHSFVDVSGWLDDPVSWMASAGVTAGAGPFTFEPELRMTRGQFAAFLFRLAGRPAADPHPFVDVVDRYQQDPVSWMAGTGITTGTSATTFSPSSVVSRAELAVFLHRYRGEPIPVGGVIEPTDAVCRPLVVHATGDVNFDPGYGPNPERPFDYAWSGLGGMFNGDDLTIINLECVPSLLGAAVPKTFNFRCPVASLPASQAAGVDVVNLANNHGGDYGTDALLDGAENVRLAGIAPVGVGANAGEAVRGAYVERHGWRIIVLGFNAKSYNPEWFATADRAGMASGVEPAAIADAVRAADERADLVFVTIHWGLEGASGPTSGDIERAQAAIDAGADAVFGHHPHRLQALGSHRGKPIFWSLGNFVWQKQARSQNTAVARVNVGIDGSVTGALVPAVIADKGHPVLLG